MQNASCGKAIARDREHDLPNRVLVMKWTQGDHWVVLDADLKEKRFRIIYSDPSKHGTAKVWNVSSSYEGLAEKVDGEKAGELVAA